MKIQKIIDAMTGRESYTIVTEDYHVIEPAEDYLAFLANMQASPNTIRSYATSLASWLNYLGQRDISWDAPKKLELLGQYVGWLLNGSSNLIVLTGEARKSRATINLYLAAIYGFYSFHSASGVGVIDELLGPARTRRTTYRPFLYGLVQAKTTRHYVRLTEPQRQVKDMALGQAISVIQAQNRLRDKFLFMLLLVTGMRIGQALGLRHSDFVSHARIVKIISRDDNANGARSKRPAGEMLGEVPITAELVHLYSDYMHQEYGDLDSDYIFVNLWSGANGKPLTYNTVNEIIIRTRMVVGFHFTAHQFRHTFATIARKAGISIDILSKLLTHRSITTTSAIYTHLDVETVRKELIALGVFEGILEEPVC